MYKNNGYTLIEMIFVLSIISIMTLLTFRHIPDISDIKFKSLLSYLRQTQLESIQMHKRCDIEINGSALYLHDRSFDLKPLVCDPVFFHYNEQGNISKAFTLRCQSKKEYEARFQLGSGWISE